MQSKGVRIWFLAILFFGVTFAYIGLKPVYANPTCILNCAQCVQLYGEYFDGHACAQLCVDAKARFDSMSYIDCADPTSIARFIKI